MTGKNSSGRSSHLDDIVGLIEAKMKLGFLESGRTYIEGIPYSKVDGPEGKIQTSMLDPGDPHDWGRIQGVKRSVRITKQKAIEAIEGIVEKYSGVGEGSSIKELAEAMSIGMAADSKKLMESVNQAAASKFSSTGSEEFGEQIAVLEKLAEYNYGFPDYALITYRAATSRLRTIFREVGQKQPVMAGFDDQRLIDRNRLRGSH